jgi:hypothetical protein
MRVKRENELSDFTNWSVLFSPTGYRHVGFCAKLVAADKLGMYASSSLGMTLEGDGWHLDYDKENSILKIRVDQRGAERFNGDPFPEAEAQRAGGRDRADPAGRWAEVRCCTITAKGTRCKRAAQRGIWDFYWCWQHWRQREGENI